MLIATMTINTGDGLFFPFSKTLLEIEYSDTFIS